MEKPQIETTGGEITLRFDTLPHGKHSLQELGLADSHLKIAGGNLRLVLAFNNTGQAKFFRNPTFVFVSDRKSKDVGWQCEFNGDVIFNKTDRSGDTTIFTLDENKLERLLRPEQNTLIVRADFPEEVSLVSAESHFHLLETPGQQAGNK